MVGRAQAEIQWLAGGLVNGEAFSPSCTGEINAHFYTRRQVACVPTGNGATAVGKTLQ